MYKVIDKKTGLIINHISEDAIKSVEANTEIVRIDVLNGLNFEDKKIASARKLSRLQQSLQSTTLHNISKLLITPGALAKDFIIVSDLDKVTELNLWLQRSALLTEQTDSVVAYDIDKFVYSA